MTEPQATRLRDLFGDEIELGDAQGRSEAYRIVAELSVSGRDYAVLQTAEMSKEGDIEVFRLIEGGDGEPELETVTDDDEWEAVAEAYDDLQFGTDERP